MCSCLVKWIPTGKAPSSNIILGGVNLNGATVSDVIFGSHARSGSRLAFVPNENCVTVQQCFLIPKNLRFPWIEEDQQSIIHLTHTHTSSHRYAHTHTHLHTTIIHIYPKEAKQTPPYSPPNNPCPTPHPFLPSSLGCYGEEQEEALNVAKHGGGEFEPPIIIVCHHQHRRRLNQQQQQQQQQSPQSHLHLHTLFRWSFRIFPALSRQLRGTRTAPEIPPDWQDSAPRESHQETTGSSNMYYFFKYFYSTKKRYKKK